MAPRLALVLALASACASPAKRVALRPAAAQLRLEQHLLATMPLQGEPRHAALADRMATHRIPGVSIAISADYELVFAAAYHLRFAASASHRLLLRGRVWGGDDRRARAGWNDVATAEHLHAGGPRMGGDPSHQRAPRVHRPLIDRSHSPAT